MSSQGLNVAYLIGTICADPESRASVSGAKVVKLSIAVPSSRKVDNAWVDTPEYHRVIAHDREATYLEAYAKKGWRIAVECTVRPQCWTDKDGGKHTDVALVLKRVLWLSGSGVKVPAVPAPPTAPSDDDTPF